MDEEKEKKNIIVEFLKEKGLLGLVVLSVAFNVANIIKALFFDSDIYKFKYYVWITFAGTITFFGILIFIYAFEQIKSRKITFRILNEKNEYDLKIQDQSMIIECKQNLIVEAVQNINVFHAFDPIQGHTFTDFECLTRTKKTLNIESLSKNNGYVDITFTEHQFIKNVQEALSFKWTYKISAFENRIKTTSIRRPTEVLEISVVLPLTTPKAPKQHGCDLYNREGHQVKRSETICSPYVNRYRINKKFKRPTMGFSYALWWNFD